MNTKPAVSEKKKIEFQGVSRFQIKRYPAGLRFGNLFSVFTGGDSGPPSGRSGSGKTNTAFD